MPDHLVHVATNDEQGRFAIDDLFVEEVEKILGMPNENWDRAEAQELCAAVVCVFINRNEVKVQ